jgi:nicotinamidase-related amidase
MLDLQKCCLVVVDVQGKLAQLMHDRQALFKNIQILIKAAQILNIPILWCQQCPDALGPTVPEIAQLLAESEPINKTAFSCCGVEQFNARLNELARNQVLLCGIETHVCIYQTAIDLLRKGFNVNVIADAVSSRTSQNKQIAINKMNAEKINISCTEMALFELLKNAEHPQFKQIAKLIK